MEKMYDWVETFAGGIGHKTLGICLFIGMYPTLWYQQLTTYSVEVWRVLFLLAKNILFLCIECYGSTCACTCFKF